VFDISFCSAAVVMSSYLLIFTSINQLNPTIRTLTKYKKTSFSLANGFITGGAIAIMFSVSNEVLYSYPLASTSDPLFSVTFGTAGTILVCLGTLWITYLYLKFRKSPTGAQGARI